MTGITGPHPADGPATDLPNTEPAVSWALVQAFVQSLVLVGDVTMFSSWRPEVLGAVHGVLASAVAIAGALYTRNRTVTNAALDALEGVTIAPTDELAQRVVEHLDDRAMRDHPEAGQSGDGDPRGPAFLVPITPDVSLSVLRGLYELATEASPPTSWNRAAIVAELERRGVELTARSAA